MMNRKIFFIIIAAGMAALSGCKVGPTYTRPEIKYDSLFRYSHTADSNSLGQVQWVTLLKDQVLIDLINKGLQNNFDVAVAYARVEQARGYFKQARGDQFPSVGVSGDAGFYQQPVADRDVTADYHQYAGVATLSYEVDLWGKLRHAKQAARAELFRQQAYQQLVRLTLLNSIAASYFDLLEYDNELIILKETIGIRQKSLDLVRAKLIAGTASGLVVAQAEAELALAQQEVPRVEMLIGQEENYICLLLGEKPHPIERGLPMMDQIIPPSATSPGIPSTVIVNRPDVMMSEQELISANANIGVARANMLPSLTISGYAGYTFSPTNFIYSAVGNLVAPIFSGGKLRANLRVSEAKKAEMLASYQKTLFTALSEVSDALLAVQKSSEIVIAQQATYTAAKTAFDLSTQLYDAGYASYLDVINAQGLLLETQISLSMAQSDELTAKVNLYTALGGGIR